MAQVSELISAEWSLEWLRDGKRLLGMRFWSFFPRYHIQDTEPRIKLTTANLIKEEFSINGSDEAEVLKKAASKIRHIDNKYAEHYAAVYEVTCSRRLALSEQSQ